jgi:hypothetical protein
VKPAAGYRPLAYSSPEAVQTTGTVAGYVRTFGRNSPCTGIEDAMEPKLNESILEVRGKVILTTIYLGCAKPNDEF